MSNSPATAAKLVDALIMAAQSAKFWEDHGRRGDGNLEQARANLTQARRDVMAAIRAGK